MRTGFWRELLCRRWFPMVGSATLRFRHPLDPFQRYKLVTRRVAWDEKWCFVEQRFERGGHVHAVGRGNTNGARPGVTGTRAEARRRTVSRSPG